MSPPLSDPIREAPDSSGASLLFARTKEPGTFGALYPRWATPTLHSGPSGTRLQTEDRKHGTQVVQADDAGPARAGADRPFGAVQGPPRQIPHRGSDEIGRAQQHRADYLATSRGRGETPLPDRRFQAHQTRRGGHRRADRI